MSKTDLVYLDNAATTEVDEDILNKFNEINKSYFGNTSSIHALGQSSFALLEKARRQILETFKLSDSHEVIFTSGATEGNNMSIKGVAFKYANRGKHIIVGINEHPSVLEACHQLEMEFGYEITYISTDQYGYIHSEDVEAAIRKDTILVSIMAVNNESGVINPIGEISRIVKKYPKVIFHVDATQAIGKIEIPFKDVDLFTYSAHKIHGLHGSGALIKRKTITLSPLFAGGGQEYNLRSGTNDLANDVALAVITKKMNNDIKANLVKISPIYACLREYITKNEDEYELNSYDDNNPYILNFSLKKKKASVVVEALSNAGIMVSSTSACHSKKEAGSYVIKAMNKSELLSKNTIRVSFSNRNILEDVERLIKELDIIVKEVKNK